MTTNMQISNFNSSILSGMREDDDINNRDLFVYSLDECVESVPRTYSTIESNPHPAVWGGNIEFSVPKQGVWTNAYLKIKLTNGGVASRLSHMAVLQLFEKCELTASGRTIESIRGSAGISSKLLMLPENERNKMVDTMRLRNQSKTGDKDTAGYAVGANETVTLFYPLLFSCLWDNRSMKNFFNRNKTEPLRVVCKLNSVPDFFVVADGSISTDLTVTKIDMITTFLELDPMLSNYKNQQEFSKKNRLDILYESLSYEITNTTTLTQNATTSRKVDLSTTGVVKDLFIYNAFKSAVDVTDTHTNNYSFLPTQIDFVVSGSTVFSLSGTELKMLCVESNADSSSPLCGLLRIPFSLFKSYLDKYNTFNGCLSFRELPSPYLQIYQKQGTACTDSNDLQEVVAYNDVAGQCVLETRAPPHSVTADLIVVYNTVQVLNINGSNGQITVSSNT